MALKRSLIVRFDGSVQLCRYRVKTPPHLKNTCGLGKYNHHIDWGCRDRSNPYSSFQQSLTGAFDDLLFDDFHHECHRQP